MTLRYSTDGRLVLASCRDLAGALKAIRKFWGWDERTTLLPDGANQWVIVKPNGTKTNAIVTKVGRSFLFQGAVSGTPLVTP